MSKLRPTREMLLSLTPEEKKLFSDPKRYQIPVPDEEWPRFQKRLTDLYHERNPHTALLVLKRDLSIFWSSAHRVLLRVFIGCDIFTVVCDELLSEGECAWPH